MFSWFYTGGLIKGLRNVAHHAVALLQTRLELLSIELQIERQRFITALLLISGTAIFSLVAVLVATFLIIELSWESEWRRPTIILLLIVYTSLALGFGITLARLIRKAPRPFSGTIKELKKDREALKLIPK